jgi:uncharacterized protein (DUF427 family)
MRAEASQKPRPPAPTEEELMIRAQWKGVVVAESARTIVVEGNHYFPPETIHAEFFQASATQTVCSWKGTARYYHLQVGGEINFDAAWYYAEPLPAAANIAGYVAFWRGVHIDK